MRTSLQHCFLTIKLIILVHITDNFLLVMLARFSPLLMQLLCMVTCQQIHKMIWLFNQSLLVLWKFLGLCSCSPEMLQQIMRAFLVIQRWVIKSHPWTFQFLLWFLCFIHLLTWTRNRVLFISVQRLLFGLVFVTTYSYVNTRLTSKARMTVITFFRLALSPRSTQMVASVSLVAVNRLSIGHMATVPAQIAISRDSPSTSHTYIIIFIERIHVFFSRLVHRLLGRTYIPRRLRSQLWRTVGIRGLQ